MPIIDPAVAWTTPENRGVCGFCGKPEGGYAKQDSNKHWRAACWPCVRPAAAGAAQPKRKPIGTVFTPKDEDAEDAPVKKKNPGMVPSSYRPAVR